MDILHIKSTHKESQGDYVVINAEDFDPSKHELYDPDAPEKTAKKRTGKKEAKKP